MDNSHNVLTIPTVPQDHAKYHHLNSAFPRSSPDGMIMHPFGRAKSSQSPSHSCRHGKSSYGLRF